MPIRPPMLNEHAPTPTQSFWCRENLILGYFAAAKLLLHLFTLQGPGWGMFRDELYYIVCGWRLDWGYVDHPPLVPLLARIGDALFGPLGIRLFSILAGVALVVLAGLMARSLGGGRLAQALACLAALVAPHYLGSQAKLATDSIEPVFWAACAYVLLRIIRDDNARLWPWFGLFAGLGLQTKHSTAFFGFAVMVGLLLTPQRRLMWNRWFAVAGIIAFFVFLPNLIWEAQHHWATLELLRNVKSTGKNVVLGPLDYLKTQFLIMQPFAFPVSLAGVGYFLFHSRGRRWRVFGWMYLVLFILFVALQGKAYYLASVYPILIAGGAVWIEEWSASAKRRKLAIAYAVLLVLTTIPLLPLVLTVFTPERTLAYQRTLRIQPPRSERSHTSELPQYFSDRLGWEEMAKSVAEVYRSLPEEERKEAEIFAQNFGEAGAIDVYGRRLGLPPALSGHQNYFFWGTHGWKGNVLIVMDTEPGLLPELCRSVEDRGQISLHPLAMPWERQQHLYVCRDLKQPLTSLWPRLKHWR